MADHEMLVTFQGQASPVAKGGLSRIYEGLVLFYLATLLFLYPYGFPLSAEASIKIPDLFGLLCLLMGAVILILKPRIRVDLLFLAVVGPFVLLELAFPVLGALGYRKLGDAVSTVRIAVLWLPMILLTMLAAPAALPRFERRLRLIFAAALWLNVPYALVLIAVDFGLAPKWMAFTRYLEPWAVIAYYEAVADLRPAGFFANTSALSVFGIVCLAYFYASYIARPNRADLVHAIGAAFVVLLTTSRAAFGATALIVFMGWFVLTARRKLVVLTLVVAGAAVILILVEKTIGIERAFYRFTRLAESGLLADVSFESRVIRTWPAALAVAADYPFGTLISAPRVADLIDSGYLNYYMQGKWLFVACVSLMLVGQLAIGFWCLGRSRPLAGGMMMLFLAIYLTVAMVIQNPVRAPVVVAFIVFAFWKLKSELASRWMGPYLRPASMS